MSTTQTAAKTSTIFGYCPAQGGKDRPCTTEKAVRVTVYEIDGDSTQADTCWLPRSIAEGLTVTEVREDDGATVYEVRATVPAWWVRRLDNRSAWERRGMTAPPMGSRPW